MSNDVVKTLQGFKIYFPHLKSCMSVVNLSSVALSCEEGGKGFDVVGEKAKSLLGTKHTARTRRIRSFLSQLQCDVFTAREVLPVRCRARGPWQKPEHPAGMRAGARQCSALPLPSGCEGIWMENATSQRVCEQGMGQGLPPAWVRKVVFPLAATWHETLAHPESARALLRRRKPNTCSLDLLYTA